MRRMSTPSSPTPAFAHSGFAQSGFAQYRAPRGDRQCLIDPGLGAADSLIRANAALVADYPSELSALRARGRGELLRDAVRYTSAYRSTAPQRPDDAPIVMAGHQPTLFHPGVWFKNFALDQIASQTGATAINLVVDSDVAGPSSIRVPSLDPQSGHIGLSVVPFDRRGGGVPYEQSLIEDRDRFDSFDVHVTRAVKGIVDQPLIGALWQHARDAIQRCGYAGCALAQARHALESDLGLNTLEVPQSVICRHEAFAAFSLQILRDLPRFHRCYNEAADHYRAAHGIRSSAHPVPNLKRVDDWWEAPFWLYGNQSPKRKSLWARRVGTELQLSDLETRNRKLSDVDDPDAGEALAALATPEWKLRSRALVTTMYARLITSDLFLHGIGGGKYDQLGDLISGSFWKITPPQLMVVSATVLLPGHESFDLEHIETRQRQLQRELRDSRFRPDSFADQADLDPTLLERKRELLRHIPPRGERAQWHQQITRTNQQLSDSLRPLQSQLRQTQTELEKRHREAAIWNSREHSFSIYPAETLMDAYRQMLSS